MFQPALRFKRWLLAVVTAPAMKSSVGWIPVWLLVGGFCLAVTQPASAQATSPLTVTGVTSSQIDLNSENGGHTWRFSGNDFALNIREATNDIFTIKAGAPFQTMVIDSSGRVLFNPGGAGPPIPQRVLHLFDSDAPGLRLEQNNFTGNGAQTFDLEGSELGFSIIDVTNSNRIPFTIEPGATTNSLFVDSVGNVGLGTGTPTAPLHLLKVAQASTAEILAKFAVSDDAVGSLVISNSSAGNGNFIPKVTGRSGSSNAALINEALITTDVGAAPAIVYNAAKGAGGALSVRPLVVYRNNGVAKATIAANGDINATSFNPSSSREIKQDIVDLDAASATEALKTLTPVKYVYKDDESKEPRVGFIAEDVPELVANADRKSVPIMDVVALVTRVVKDQQQIIDEQRKVNDAQKKTIDLLMKRLEALESHAFAK